MSWGDGYAFFRRRADRSIDETDLRSRCAELELFLRDLSGCQSGEVRHVLCGVSNGAVMGAALLLRSEVSFAGAILLRPMPPFATPPPADLNGMPVLILDGKDDARRRSDDASQLAEQLQRSGAIVEHQTVDAGHAPSRRDTEIIKRWLPIR